MKYNRDQGDPYTDSPMVGNLVFIYVTSWMFINYAETVTGHKLSQNIKPIKFFYNDEIVNVPVQLGSVIVMTF